MSQLKALINSLTDFEFLSSISSVDFHQKKIHFKRHFWNTLIKIITKNVDIRTERDLHAVISSIKKMCFTRLGLVSPHSMKRFFLQNIPMVFEAFQHRIEKFFRTRVEPKKSGLTEEEKNLLKKERKREARRRNRNNRRQRKILEQEVIFEEEKITNGDESSEYSSEEEKEEVTDENVFEFNSLQDLKTKFMISDRDLTFLEENYPNYWKDIIESKRVIKHAFLAHLDFDVSSEEEEEEEESTGDESTGEDED